MNAAPVPLNTAPVRHWQAEIDVRLQHRLGVTRVTHRRQRGPLAIQRPFYPEGDLAHLYLLHPPGGVVGGDTIDIGVACEGNANVLLTTPGATKFYRGNGFQAMQRQRFETGARGSLEWFPQENIFFSGAVADLKTDIRLPGDGAFIGWEINCFGLPAAGEAFESGRVRSLMRVFDAGRLLLHERFHHEPDRGRGNGPTGLRGNAVAATLVAAPAGDAMQDRVRERIEEAGFPCGVTRLGPLLVVRCLGPEVEKLKDLLIQVWQCLRPMLVNRTAIVPRIWAI